VCLKAANKEIESLRAQVGQHKKLRQHVALKLLKEGMTIAKVNQIIAVDQAAIGPPLAESTRHGYLNEWTRAWMDASAGMNAKNLACEA